MSEQPAVVHTVLQNVVESGEVPQAQDFQRWVDTAYLMADEDVQKESTVTIRVVDEAEGRELNSSFRDIPRPTNVLAFPGAAPAGLPPAEIGELGDLVICAPVVAREAVEQEKTTVAHFAHLTVHGFLHLLGYDHDEPAAAADMESLETRVLHKLGFPDPYTTGEHCRG